MVVGVVLVDVQLLVLVCAICLLYEMVVDTIGLVLHTAILHVGEDIPVVGEAIRSLDEGAVVVLVSV